MSNKRRKYLIIYTYPVLCHLNSLLISKVLTISGLMKKLARFKTKWSTISWVILQPKNIKNEKIIWSKFDCKWPKSQTLGQTLLSDRLFVQKDKYCLYRKHAKVVCAQKNCINKINPIVEIILNSDRLKAEKQWFGNKILD